MYKPTWPWLASGILLILAGLAAFRASWLWWLPCRGQMLYASIIRGRDYGPGFSDACLERMNDGSPFPLPTAAVGLTPGLLAWCTLVGVLAGLAWVVLVCGLPFGPGRRAALLLPGCAVTALALAGVATGTGSEAIEDVATLLAFAVNVCCLIAAVPVVTNDSIAEGFCLGVVLLAISSFSLFGVFGEYALMGIWSDANWDAPPGSGYPTSAVLILAGLFAAGVPLLARSNWVLSRSGLGGSVTPRRRHVATRVT